MLPSWKSLQNDNFRFDENGRKFSKSVENIVGKGEIACCEQFLLFPVFLRLVLQTCKKQGLFGKGLKFSRQILPLKLHLSFQV